MNSFLIILLIITLVYILTYIIYRHIKKAYTFIVVSGIGAITMLVLNAKYYYDVFILPRKPGNDGIPITIIMKWFSGNDVFNTFEQKMSGVINGLFFFVLLLTAFIVSIIIRKKLNREK